MNARSRAAALISAFLSCVVVCSTGQAVASVPSRFSCASDSGGSNGKKGQTQKYAFRADDTSWAYAYDNDGNITSQTVGSSDSKDAYTNSESYNPAGNLTSFSHTASGSAAMTTAYTWDHNSNRLGAKVTSGGSTSQQDTWSYRADNTIGTQASTVGGVAKPTRSYTYDNSGLLTKVAYTPSGGGETSCASYSYDDLDRTSRVVTAKDDACQSAEASTVAYTYDGLDRQRSATVSGSTTAAANGTSRTVFDGLSSVTVGQTGAVAGNNARPGVVYQLAADGSHSALAQSGGSAATVLLDTDGQNNVSLLVSASAGATACSVSYDPFGNAAGVTASPGNGLCLADSATSANSTGNVAWYRDSNRDGTTRNYQLGSRTYSPGSASFTGPDNYRVSSSAMDLSVGTDPLTANTYSYVNGNPLNFSDASGHDPVTPTCHTACSEGVFGTGKFDSVKQCGSACQKYQKARDDQLVAVAIHKDTVQAVKETSKSFDWKTVAREVLGAVTGIDDFIACAKHIGFNLDCGAAALDVVGFFTGGGGRNVLKGAQKLFAVFKDFGRARKLARDALAADRGFKAEQDIRKVALKKLAHDAESEQLDGEKAARIEREQAKAEARQTAKTTSDTKDAGRGADAADTAPKKVVLGEDMEGRVIPYANKVGADYYSPPEAPPTQWMENNRTWINDRMDEGCQIVDCGAAPRRANYPEPTSPYYQMERDEIAKRDYPYYSNVNIDGP